MKPPLKRYTRIRRGLTFSLQVLYTPELTAEIWRRVHEKNLWPTRNTLLSVTTLLLSHVGQSPFLMDAVVVTLSLRVHARGGQYGASSVSNRFDCARDTVYGEQVRQRYA